MDGGPLLSLRALAAEDALVDTDELSAFFEGGLDVHLELFDSAHLLEGGSQIWRAQFDLRQLLGDASAFVESPQLVVGDLSLVELAVLERPCLQRHAHLQVQGCLRDHVVELLLRVSKYVWAF